MKTILNRLILLIFTCAIAMGTFLLFALFRSKPFTSDDIYTALAIGGVLTVVNIIFGRFKDWPFKKSQ